MNNGEGSTAKNCHPVSNRIVNLLEKYAFFYSQYDFRSSQSNADLLTVIFDRIDKAFNRSGATQAVTFDISKTFDRV